MNRNRLIIVFAAFALFTNCDRNKLPDYIGPALCASDKFVLVNPLTVDNETVNFKQGTTANITAAFNEVIPWTVKVKGSLSGAIKTFSGYSGEVNINWIGNSDAGLAFFRNEVCTVELTPACKDLVTTSFSITANDFSTQAYLLSDFDLNGASVFSNPPYGLYVDKPDSGIKKTPVPASLQGGNYYRIAVTPGNETLTWFYGGTSCSFHKFNKDENDLTSHPQFASVVADPSKLYFNIFLNSNGAANCGATFTFTEFVGSSTVQRNYVVNIDWTGWRMVSFRLSDAGVVVPGNLTTLDIGLGAATVQGTTGDLVFDFPIITPGKIFNEL